MELVRELPRSRSFVWASRAISSCGLMVVISVFASSTATAHLNLPLSPSVVHAESRDLTPANVPPSSPVEPVRVHSLAPSRLSSIKLNPLTQLKSGMASWYGKVFEEHATASGERFDPLEFTAAHHDLPFGSRVRVTNQRTHRSVIVTITDRGILAPGRVIDLSYAAAEKIGMIEAGVAPVSLELLVQKNPASAAQELVAAMR